MSVEDAVMSDRRSPPCTLVIFGASGDLTERKLLPAVDRLVETGRLPHEFALVGVARTAMSDDQFRDRCRSAVARYGRGSSPAWDELAASVRYLSGDYDDPATYERLAEVLEETERAHNTGGNRVYYLATPSSLFGKIAVNLGKAALNTGGRGGFV